MTEEDVLNYENLILPKLKAFENYGDGAMIHNTKTHIGKINLAKQLYQATKSGASLQMWNEMLCKAEDWLADLVGGYR